MSVYVILVANACWGMNRIKQQCKVTASALTARSQLTESMNIGGDCHSLLNKLTPSGIFLFTTLLNAGKGKNSIILALTPFPPLPLLPLRMAHNLEQIKDA